MIFSNLSLRGSNGTRVNLLTGLNQVFEMFHYCAYGKTAALRNFLNFQPLLNELLSLIVGGDPSFSRALLFGALSRLARLPILVITVEPGRESSKDSSLNLANSLTTDSKSSSYFFQSVGFAILQAENAFRLFEHRVPPRTSPFNISNSCLWEAPFSGSGTMREDSFRARRSRLKPWELICAS